MKKYVEIFWWPLNQQPEKNKWVDVAYTPPKHFYPILRAQRAGAPYLNCPGIADNFKNSFVITAPYDLTFNIDKATNTLSTDRYGQDFYDAFVNNRMASSHPSNPALFSLAINYSFFACDSVELEIGDVPLLVSESTKNIRIIPGKFNVAKWLRPIELAVEVVDDTQPVSLRAGDPIMMVSFRTPNDVPVKLTRLEQTSELLNASHACMELKDVRPRLKLKHCYEAAESFLSRLKQRIKAKR